MEIPPTPVKPQCNSEVPKPFSSRPSPSPIAPFVQRRSSFVRLPKACASDESEQLLPGPLCFPALLPNVFFGQLRSLPEPMRTVFGCLFLFHMRYRKLQAQHRFREVPLSIDLVPSLTTARLQLNWTLSFPSREIVSKRCDEQPDSYAATLPHPRHWNGQHIA